MKKAVINCLLVFLIVLAACGTDGSAGTGPPQEGADSRTVTVRSDEPSNENTAVLSDGPSGETATAQPDEPSAGQPFKIFITSDPHVFFNTMHDDSDTYKEFESSGDGKMLSYTDPIMNAFINDILTEKPDAVIITGDLTLNGEKTGHKTLAAQLRKVTDAGIQVYVTPGNHDINNPYARLILGDKFLREEYVSPDQFAEIYNHCGFGNALYRDADTLSYIAKMNDGLYAVMLDTAMYAANIEETRSASSGTVYDETLEWLDECISEIKGKDPNARFITGMHHNLFTHHRNFDFGYVIFSAKETRQKFLEWGLNAVFSGHIHIQHILEQEGITEVVNSSLLVYPVAYGVIEVDPSGLHYRTQPVNMRRYAEQNGITDENLLDFDNFTRSIFNERAASGMSERLREAGYPEADTEEAVKTVKLINTYYFAGRIDEIKDEIMASRGYEILQETGFSAGYLESVFEEGAGEHNMVEVK